MIDAAVEAGVTRFIPSEFGIDTARPNVSELKLLNSKIEVNKYLQEKAAEGKIEYTGFVTGPFFEWGMYSSVLVSLSLSLSWCTKEYGLLTT